MAVDFGNFRSYTYFSLVTSIGMAEGAKAATDEKVAYGQAAETANEVLLSYPNNHSFRHAEITNFTVRFRYS